MANPEHEAILRQGVEVWNQWREENPDVRPDLRNVEFPHANLNSANLSNANLRGANLSSAKLVSAELNSANLNDAKFIDADLRGANLSDASFMEAMLRRAALNNAKLNNANLIAANLSDANLSNANLSNASLSNANLSDANLYNANLGSVNFIETNFDHAICSYTILVDVDLSSAKGLRSVHHNSPSSLGINTIFRSKGEIPEIFLRGCGIPETLITFLPSMYQEAIVFYSCFISYSHDDKAFAHLLHDRLQGQGIRCWLDEHQLKPGDELHKTIYEGIHVYDKVILCCSETALKSWWVEKEFKNAITKEEDYTETVLIPITLDDYLFKQSKDNWTIGEINRRFVQDFSGWKDHDAFESAFKKVVDALRTDGGKPPPPPSKLTRRKP